MRRNIRSRRFWSALVLPLLIEQHTATGAGRAVRDRRQSRSDHQRRIFRSVFETGQVAAVLVRPAIEMAIERCDAAQFRNCFTTEIEHVIVRGARNPDPQIRLRGRHGVALGTRQRLVEAEQSGRRSIGIHLTPQLRPKPDDDVRAADRLMRFVDVNDRLDETLRIRSGNACELHVHVGGIAECKNTRLGDSHEYD